MSGLTRGESLDGGAEIQVLVLQAVGACRRHHHVLQRPALQPVGRRVGGGRVVEVQNAGLAARAQDSAQLSQGLGYAGHLQMGSYINKG